MLRNLLLLALVASAWAANDEATITIVQANNAPTWLVASPVTLSSGEYTLQATAGRAAIQVTLDPAVLASRIDDIDLWSVKGIAITAYGSGMTPPYTVSGTNAKLFGLNAGANTFTFTLPASSFGGTTVDDATWPVNLQLFQAYAWDQTDGAVNFANPNPNGGRTAYSATQDWTQVPVPAWIPGGWSALPVTVIPAPYALKNIGINPTNAGRTVNAIVVEQNLKTYGVAVTGYDATTNPGQFQYKKGAGAWTNFPVLVPGQALLLDNTCTVRFGPAGDPDGSQPDVVTGGILNVSLWAVHGANAASGSIVTLASRTDVPLALPAQFFHLIPVNDEPTVDSPVASTSVPSTATARTVAVGTINPGAPDETSQVVTAIIDSSTLSRADLFSVAPAFDAQNRLTFTPNGQIGSATITFHLHDDGGTAWGGDDVSPSYSILVLVGIDMTLPAPYALQNSGVNPTNTGMGVWDLTQLLADHTTGHPQAGWLLTGFGSGLPPGTWQYNLTASGSWTDVPGIPSGQALRLDHQARLRFVPTGPGDDTQPDLTVANAVHLREWAVDGDQATSGTLVDLTTLGAANGPVLPDLALHLIPVNDQPVIQGALTAFVVGGSGTPVTIQVFSGVNLGASDETSQTWSVATVSSSVPGGLLSAGPSWDASGNLLFTPVSGATGSFSVTYHVVDNGGTAWGGVDTSTDATVTIAVVPGYTVSAPYALLNSGANPTNVGADMPTLDGAMSLAGGGVAVLSAVAPGADGRWQYRLTGASPWTDVPSIPAGSCLLLDDRASLRWLPIGPGDGTQPDRTLANLATVQSWVVTGAQAASGTVVTVASRSDLGAAGLALNVHLIPVNDQPVIQGAQGTLVYAQSGPAILPVFSGVNLGASDETSQTWSVATVSSSVPGGLLSAGPSWDASGNLLFTPVSGATGSFSVTYHVVDNGGTAWGGVDTSTDATVTVLVARSYTVSAPYALLNSGANPTNVGADMPTLDGAMSLAGGGVAVLSAVAPGADGRWQYRLTGASPWTDVPSIPAGSCLLLDDRASLRWLPIGPGDGTQPDRTLAAQGLLQSWAVTGAQAASGSVVTVASRADLGTAGLSLDVHLIPVNDQPSATGVLASAFVSRTAGAVTLPAFSGWNAGVVDEAGQSILAVTVVSVGNSALFTGTPTISTGGVLSLTPSGVNGTTTITWHLRDDGGTAWGGVDLSVDYVLTITCDDGRLIQSPYALRNVGVNPLNAGVTAGTLTTSIGEPGMGLAVTSLDTTTIPGHWEYQVVGNGWSTAPAIGAGQVLLLDSSTQLRFVPAGPGDDTQPAATARMLMARSWVPVGGQAGTLAPAATTSLGTAMDGMVQAIPVNDQPAVVGLVANVTSLRTVSVTRTVWSSIDRGASDEAAQSVAIINQAVSNLGLFQAGPTLGTDGVLTYTPVPDTDGSAILSFQIQDNGGTAWGGSDTSITYSISISVSGGGSNATVPAPYALGNYGINPWNTGRAVADLLADYGQNAAPGLLISGADLATIPGVLQWKPVGGFWASAPAVSPTAALLLDPTCSVRFAPRGQAGGLQPAVTANRIVQTQILASWPTGATSGMQLDTTPMTLEPAFISFTCIPVNDPPYVQDVNWSTRVPMDPGPRSAPLFGHAVAGPADEVATQHTSVSLVRVFNPNLFLVQPAVDAGGNLTFTGKNGIVGSTLVQYQVTDDGGTAWGGVDHGKVLPFIVSIGEAHQPPILVPQDQTVTAVVGVPLTIVISAYEPQNQTVSASFLRTSQLGATLGRITSTRQSGVQQPWTVSFTYTAVGIGTETLYIPVTNTDRLEAMATVTVTVQPLAPIQDRPVIVSRPNYWWLRNTQWNYQAVTEAERLGGTPALDYQLLDGPSNAILAGPTLVWDTTGADLLDADPVMRFLIKVQDHNDPSRYDVQQIIVAPQDRTLRKPATPGGGG